VPDRWSVGFVHEKNGSLVFLLLSIWFFLVGGGVTVFISKNPDKSRTK
jgi:hypothetical protein